MKTFLLSLFLLITYAGQSQCDPVSSIDENFDDWTSIDECWATITQGALVYTEEGAITYYSLFSPNTTTMLVTSEIAPGNYTLMFDAGVIAGSSTSVGLQIQIGTLTGNADASTFTPIEPAFDLTTTSTTYSVDVTVGSGEYLAFSAILPVSHSAFGLDNVVLGQCLAVSSIDESFDDWTSIDECWATITQGALVYTEEGAITYYSLFSPNTTTMLVTREIVSGDYTLEFDAGVIAGSSTSVGLQIQIGTLTNNADASTFTSIGSPFDLTTTSATYSVDVTVGSGEYLAFSATLPTSHSALGLDNIMLSNSLSVPGSLKNNLEIKVYPNPSSDGMINLVYDANKLNSNKNIVSVYSITGTKVFSTILNNNSGLYNKKLDLSNLQSGIYMLQFTSGDYSITKKIILK